MKLFPKNVFILEIILLCATNLFAQGPDTMWTKTYGGSGADFGYSVQQTSDNGYIIAGYTESFGAGMGDVYLIKTDANGDTLWTNTFGGYFRDEGWSVQQTFDNGYIITGYKNSDVYLIKTDSIGNGLWEKTYGYESDDCGYSVQQTSDSGYIVVGRMDPYDPAHGDVYLIKTDTNGDTIWTRTYGGSWYDEGNSVKQISDNGYIIAGHTESFGAGMGDAWLIKTNANGGTIWTRTYGGSLPDLAYSVQQTFDSGYIIAGKTYSSWPGNRDLYLIKTAPNGDTLWTRAYGGTDEEEGWQVQQLSDSGYIIAGYTQSFGAGCADFYLIRTDANGDTIWTKTYGGEGSDKAYSMQQTSDKGYIITGYTYNFTGNFGFDVWLVKTVPDLFGIEEEELSPIESNDFSATIISGPLLLPEDRKCKVFDIIGRTVTPDKLRVGIYFLEIDGQITKKVIKIR